MNRNKLKTYAPKARRAFIQAVTARASKFGINASKIEPVQVQGDVALIGGQAFPRKVAEQRRKLEERITLRGFEQVMEEAAYTWFNRFAAIRFMEVHGYLDHGYRVLSHPEGKATPEIIEHAEHIDLPGLDREKVIELKLDGTKDEELYRTLLTAQCNALHTAMQFLFERLDDETELLLPDNLLHSDSLIRQMVSQIDEADWQEIEIIGWLYQFYISEKKDEVIGTVVRSEDIPAATQLFTPNWIVKYMVQNSLGAKWLEANPRSDIRSKMQYYVETISSSTEIMPVSSMAGAEISPERITFLDPACGSGHILVEAYDLLKDMYLEVGYSPREIPELILEHNLYGFDIDSRATQMASFALLMKAREDDRRIFSKEINLNIITIQSAGGIDPAIAMRVCAPERQFKLLPSDDLLPETLVEPMLALTTKGNISPQALRGIIETFENADTLGALIEVSDHIKSQLPNIAQAIENISYDGTLSAHEQEKTARDISVIIKQATLLSQTYDCVVANPPYMGGKSMCPTLRGFAKKYYQNYKSDLFSIFVMRMMRFGHPRSTFAFMTPFVWMFLSSYEEMRRFFTQRMSIQSLVHPEYHSFFDSAYVPLCSFVLNARKSNNPGIYFNLTKFNGADLQPIKLREAIQNRTVSWRHEVVADEFSKVPGSPIAYWVSKSVRDVYARAKLVADYAVAKQGMATGSNDIFMRYWHEVSMSNVGFGMKTRDEAMQSGRRWFPCTKGGEYRKWYGNNEWLVDWENDGERIRSFKDQNGKLRSRPQNMDYYFKEGMTWSTLTIANLSMRDCPSGFLFETKGSMCFPHSESDRLYLLSFFNTKLVNLFLSATSPTLDYHEGPVSRLPIIWGSRDEVNALSKKAIEYAKSDWDAQERSWDFQMHPLLWPDIKAPTIEQSCINWDFDFESNMDDLAAIETDINSFFIHAYGLSEEMAPDVDRSMITIEKGSTAQGILRLVSFSIGCMLGRYSLAEPGLIYANSGNVGFDASRYGDFPADDDGIIPVTEAEWFSDDATNRFAEFLKVAWSPETLKENLKFVADSLGAKANETPMDTIRRYLSRDFYKDHLKTYKKRPIYWLFSSGKEKAFECLVYLHRYNEGTLSRMRMEYVTPLQGRVSARIEQLDRDIQAASTTAAQKKLRMEQEKLKKQQAELIKFDEELRHYADKRIKLDLDDGVKVNYGKFGNLLAEVKTVTGGSDE